MTAQEQPKDQEQTTNQPLVTPPTSEENAENTQNADENALLAESDTHSTPSSDLLAAGSTDEAQPAELPTTPPASTYKADNQDDTKTEDADEQAQLSEAGKATEDNTVQNIAAGADETETPATSTTEEAETTAPTPAAKLVFSTQTTENQTVETPEDTHENEESEEVEEEINLDNLGKEELFKLLNEKTRATANFKYDSQVKAIKAAFDQISENDKQLALSKFLEEEGAEEADFQYKPDQTTREFEALHYIYIESRRKYYAELEKQRETNLKVRQGLIEQLRELVEGEETTVSMATLRQLQDNWKAVGPIPRGFSADLYATWRALVDKFYDNRSIYFELKELDRKKNLEAKKDLITKAQALGEENSLNKAVKELNELHKEWQNIGPVPKDEQEPLWQAFKSASDTIYSKRREYLEEMKGKQSHNLEQKRLLLEKAQIYATFNSERIDDWNTKNKEVLALQEQWKEIGRMPIEEGPEINKQFWAAIKDFFTTKNQFFKALEDERRKNLEAKTQLCVEAESYVDSDDWDATARRLRDMQGEWKNIGAVPNKFRDSIYNRFKKAVDAFFERKREQTNSVEKTLRANDEARLTIIADMERDLVNSTPADATAVREYVTSYTAIERGLREQAEEISAKFKQVLDSYIDKLVDLPTEEKEKLKLETLVKRSKAEDNRGGGGRGGDRRGGNDNRGDRRDGGRGDRRGGHDNRGGGAGNELRNTEQGIRRQITTLENQIHSYENNLSFFANSRNADALKADVNKKIEALQKDVEKLKEQLKLVRQA